MKTSASVLFSLAALLATAEASELWVTIDHARVYKTEEKIGSIIVGNPSVADITVKSPTELILFGITPGTTSLTLFGTKGEEIESISISVRNQTSNRLTLQTGAVRYTFSCTNVCEQVPAIGDGTNVSRVAATTVEAQAAARLDAARSSANGSQGIPMQPTDPFLDNDNGNRQEEAEAGS